MLENLQEIEDEGEIYESIEDIWPDYPSKDDFFFNEEEYWKEFWAEMAQNDIVKLLDGTIHNRAVSI